MDQHEHLQFLSSSSNATFSRSSPLRFINISSRLISSVLFPDVHRLNNRESTQPHSFGLCSLLRWETNTTMWIRKLRRIAESWHQIQHPFNSHEYLYQKSIRNFKIYNWYYIQHEYTYTYTITLWIELMSQLKSKQIRLWSVLIHHRIINGQLSYSTQVFLYRTLANPFKCIVLK